jgi:hypothetical protein
MMKKIAADSNYRMLKRAAPLNPTAINAIWNSMESARSNGEDSAPFAWDAGPLSQEIEFRWIDLYRDIQWRFADVGGWVDTSTSWNSVDTTDGKGAVLWGEQKSMIKILRHKRDVWRKSG